MVVIFSIRHGASRLSSIQLGHFSIRSAGRCRVDSGRREPNVVEGETWSGAPEAVALPLLLRAAWPRMDASYGIGSGG